MSSTYIYFTRDSSFTTNEFPHSAEFHRDDGPALIRINNGKVVSEKWYHDNMLHRVDGPAVSLCNHELGIKRCAYFFNGKHYLNIQEWESEVLRQTLELS